MAESSSTPEGSESSDRRSGAAAGHDPAEESQSQRVNREFIELLQELRIAVPGIQILFAFLLTVPFNPRFVDLSDMERACYLATLIACAVSTICLIEPTAYHRARFREGVKERTLAVAHGLIKLGLAALAVAVVGVLFTIASFVYSAATGIVLGVLAVAGFLGVWVLLPLADRRRSHISSRPRSR
jgi:hypothetical protein